jgi:putative DNA-binding protein
MAVRYDLYKNPDQKNDKRKNRMHARVVPYRTMELDEIAELLEQKCTLTSGDVKMVVIELSRMIADRLKDGYNVHVDGLGYFKMSLDCPPVHSPKEIRAESISFRSVAFRADQNFKDKFRSTRFECMEEKRHSKDRSAVEIQMLLTDYFVEHDYISRKDFQVLCGFTQSTASRKIKELVEQKCLKKEGLYNFPIYVPVSGNYRK